MISLQEGGLSWYIFQSFEGIADSHGVFTRHGGVSKGHFATLNVGHTVGDDPVSVQENHRRVYAALGIRPDDVVTTRQVHGDRVAVAQKGDGGCVFVETDALLSDVPGLVLLLRFADCVPVFFYAPKREAIGLAHAGWQGTLKGIASKTAQVFMAAFRCQPEDVQVGIGPSIGPCCFQVGPEIVERVRAEDGPADELLSHVQPDGRAHLDLWRMNVLQLQSAGLWNIEVAKLCTCCEVGSFYSHRCEDGHTGRFAAVIGLP
jgi:YfiH family protein